MNECPSCDAPMQSRRCSRGYSEAGVPHVLLQDVEVLTCAQCGEEVFRLPNPEQLHRLIALLFVTSLRRLLPAEIKFLRKYLGLSSSSFAARLGVSDGEVLSWEGGGSTMPLWREIQLRLMIGSERPIQSYALRMASSRQPKVAYRPEKKRWSRDGNAQMHAP